MTGPNYEQHLFLENHELNERFEIWQIQKRTFEL